MKRLMTIIFMSVVAISVAAQDANEIIARAYETQQTQGLDAAVEVLRDGLNAAPQSLDLKAYLGFYLTQQAGNAQNFMDAGRLSGEAFQILDGVIEANPAHVKGHLFRGVLGVNVPEFMGRLDQSISDLEFAQENGDNLDPQYRGMLLRSLATGYKKTKATEKETKILQAICTQMPNSAEAQSAKARLDEIQHTSEARPASTPEKPVSNEIQQIIRQGQTHLESGRAQEAATIYRQAINEHPREVQFYLLLAEALGEVAGAGYNESIHEDTNVRSNLAMEIMELMNQAVDVAPENLDVRFLRGQLGVSLPFFVRALDQGMTDLEMVAESDAASDSLQAKAKTWLGYGYKKKATALWDDVVVNHPKTGARATALEFMAPQVSHLDIRHLKKPAVKVEFVIGFQDDLPPQTAVWVEDDKEQHVATVYVSGFSGFVKEKQVVLPQWASATNFEQVDGVTAASIDCGHHIYVWDLKDRFGKKVKPGTYTVHVEVSHWPNTLYQREALTIQVGKKANETRVEKGDVIPFASAAFLPK